MSAQPIVWISTPVRKLKDKGTITKAGFEALAVHWPTPIQELSRDESLPWTCEVSLAGGGGVARARNKVVSEFLGSSAELLCMVDYGLRPPDQDYQPILQVMPANPQIQ